MPKVSQEARKSIPKIIEHRALTPPKIEAKRLLNGLPKQSRIKSQQGGATQKFLEAIFWDFEASSLPRWAHVGGQDGAKIDKKSMPKTMKI